MRLLGRLGPASSGGLLRGLNSLFRRHGRSPSFPALQPALAPQGHGGWVFPVIGDGSRLTGRIINDGRSHLVHVGRTLARPLRHQSTVAGTSVCAKFETDPVPIVRVWQDRLGLERWKIDVKVSAEPLGGFADVQASSQYDFATVTFAAGIADEVAEQTVVHELLHLLLRDLDAAMEDARSQLHPQASLQVEKRYEFAQEGFVDRLAARIVEFGGAL